MSRKIIFEFLKALGANNSKEWMDANRNWYHETKDAVVEIFDPILIGLKDIDPRIIQPTARKSISRINNNLMFHPDRPTYKDHFGLVFGFGKGLADYYVQLSLERNLVAGGLWHPEMDKLKMVRSEIDYEGDKLENALKSEPFHSWFEMFAEDSLKTTPKGFDKDHPHIELLRLKSIGATRMMTMNDVLSNGYSDLILESYEAVLPMIDFLNTALENEP